MNFKEKLGLIISIMAMTVSFNGLAFAESTKTTIRVSATVVARLSQSIIHQELLVNVTEGDLKRGFIEIPSGTILQVKTNASNGYALFFEGSNELFEEVLVRDRGRTIALSRNGGLVHQPYSGSNIEVKDLSYKLQLKEDIQPGIYPFPFRVQASLL